MNSKKSLANISGLIAILSLLGCGELEQDYVQDSLSFIETELSEEAYVEDVADEEKFNDDRGEEQVTQFCPLEKEKEEKVDPAPSSPYYDCVMWLPSR